MSVDSSKENNWSSIVKQLVDVGTTDANVIDYFSSLMTHHLLSYGLMMDKKYDETVTKEQLKSDWADSSVVDVLDRIVAMEDASYRRSVRILVHFLDFGALRTVDRTTARENSRLRFDIYELMQDLRNLRAGNDSNAYDQALTGLRTIESAAKT